MAKGFQVGFRGKFAIPYKTDFMRTDCHGLEGNYGECDYKLFDFQTFSRHNRVPSGNPCSLNQRPEKGVRSG